jgi:prepilin-type N-terminal cleavage/methylation domain-containing protein/prepilin-type processing-associated H-X9-DG protein
MMMKRRNRSGFTLVELLVVVAMMAILASLAMPAYEQAIQHANSTGCASHMRLLGQAFDLYANDHDGRFPGRITGTATDKWPKLLLPYVSDVKNYVDPGDPVANMANSTILLSNSANNSSFFFNGFNDLGANANPNIQISMANITNAPNLILLGQKVNGNTQYYMDFVEGNQDDILHKNAYFGGANYTFADGSSRFITQTDYEHVSPGSTVSDGDKMWLINQSYVIPPVPAGH